jgi:hypothetical protein
VQGRRVLIVVWDGLRPDLVTESETPTVCRLRERGGWFERSFCVYPTETRVNAASLATGAYPPAHGIVGNTLFLPQVDAVVPLDTGDHDVLVRIERAAGPLVGATPLGRRVLEAGGAIAVVSSGSPGSAFLCNPLAGEPGTLLINRELVLPAEQGPAIRRRFGPAPPGGTPATAQNEWITRLLLEHVLPEVQPVVAICWYRDPDTTLHKCGLGSPEALAALRANDRCLAALLDGLDRLGWTDSTDILLTSDHGFSSVKAVPGGGISRGLVDAGLKRDAHSTDVIVSGGAIYLSDDAAGRAPAIVAWLQQQPWIGNVFVRDDGPADGLPGTIALSAVWDGWSSPRCPAIQCSFQWTDEPNEAGVPGISLRASGVATHGSASPYDLRHTLVVAGPHFRQGYVSALPAGIVDIAPTVLALLDLPPLPTAQGRVLREACRDAATTDPPREVEDEESASAVLPGGRVYRQRVRLARVGDTAYLLGGWAARSW